MTGSRVLWTGSAGPVGECEVVYNDRDDPPRDEPSDTCDIFRPVDERDPVGRLPTVEDEWHRRIEAANDLGSARGAGQKRAWANGRRRAGELLKGMDKAKGGRPGKTPDIVSAVSLKELGVEQQQSSRWQRMASVPDKALAEAVALGLDLEAIERPKAAQRVGGRPRKGATQSAGKLPAVSGDVRDTVGAGVGMSGKTYERAKPWRSTSPKPRCHRLLGERHSTRRPRPVSRTLKSASVPGGCFFLGDYPPA